ncbi:MAG: hypothetical protein K2Y21_05815 [Phycisphaerales bacterium]|nr:hypothetical protein [Phycisphaerales bacterium]
MLRSLIVSSLAVVVACGLGGCAGAGNPEFRVAATDYDVTFDAARDVLAEYRFTLSRVDARAGVITAGPKTTAGLFTPWDTEQSRFSQEWEDTLNKQQRRVEITFTPTEAVSTDPAAEAGVIADARRNEIPTTGARRLDADLLESRRDTVARVVVVVERIHTYGVRPNTRSVYLISGTTDPTLPFPGSFEEAFSDDPPLAARLARKIEARAAEMLRKRAIAQAE